MKNFNEFKKKLLVDKDINREYKVLSREFRIISRKIKKEIEYILLHSPTC